MRYRLFGRTGLRVSELFLGAMRLPDAAQARHIVDAYADAGGNVIDTASAYGESESLLGEVITGRDRFVVATKFGLSRDPGDPNAAGAHRKNLVASLERSLRRLRTDHVDILWVHTWDPHTPVEETLRALDDLVRAGKVRYVGLSDMPAWTISRADAIADWKGWTRPEAVQVPYSLVNRDIEREILPMADELGLTVAAWGVLDHGTLTAPGDGASPVRERVATALTEIAGDLGTTPGRVAIAWSRARSPAIHPLIGFRSDERIADTVAALDLRLPDEALAALDAAAPFDAGPYAEFVAGSTRDPFVVGNARVIGRGRPPGEG